MGYSLHKKNEGEGKVSPDFEYHFQPSLQSPFHIPTPQNQRPKYFKIGEWLLDQRWITPDQLAVALKEQTRSQKRLGELMLDLLPFNRSTLECFVDLIRLSLYLPCKSNP